MNYKKIYWKNFIYFCNKIVNIFENEFNKKYRGCRNYKVMKIWIDGYIFF